MTIKMDSQFNIHASEDLTHNVQPLLYEIRHALENLNQTGEGHIIDLRSIPLAPGEEERLLGRLGQGEIVVKLNALGPSEICETAFPGVWVVTHFNDENNIIGRFVEITRIPEIVMTQQQDMAESLDRLDEELAQATETYPI